MHITDLKNAVLYTIPSGYWRLRASQYLVEMDEISESNLDWKHLCLEVKKVDL